MLGWVGAWPGRPMISTRKSKCGVPARASCTSYLLSVLRLASSRELCCHDLCSEQHDVCLLCSVTGVQQLPHLIVRSTTNISTALASSTGASALIMRTSSSAFIMRLMRARGRSLCVLYSACRSSWRVAALLHQHLRAARTLLGHGGWQAVNLVLNVPEEQCKGNAGVESVLIDWAASNGICAGAWRKHQWPLEPCCKLQVCLAGNSLQNAGSGGRHCCCASLGRHDGRGCDLLMM